MIGNKRVAEILHEIGLMLEIKGENPFKSRAYFSGAQTMKTLDEDLEKLIKEDRLKELPGIGATLTEKITELVTTGFSSYYEELKAEIPSGVLDLLKIPGLGPKKAGTLYKELGIASLGELEYACKENRLVTLKGFGEKTQENFLKGIADLKRFQGKYLLNDGKIMAETLIGQLKDCPWVIEGEIAGSIRRAKEIIKDLDLVVSTLKPEKVAEFFMALSQVEEIISHGETFVSVKLKEGIHADLRIVTPEQFPYALLHFTGSKEHNIAIRSLAKSINFKINEYGVFHGQELKKCRNEAEIYRLFALEYIPPELRENLGEIEAALEWKLPQLVDTRDIQGVLHVHTNYSDGRDSIEEMVKGAIRRGYRYLGISDHSQSAFYAGGLKEEDILRQHEEIDHLQEKYPEILILKGIEADILTDGSLDYTDEVLTKFDFVIASIHSHFRGGVDLTDRLIKAISHPSVTILGHPTGRLLLARDGYHVDYERLFEKATEYNVAIELNASPARLDLDWRYLRKAKKYGIKISINPDAHRVEDLDDLQYGLLMARKGWLEAKDVLNSMSPRRIRKYFKEKGS